MKRRWSFLTVCGMIGLVPAAAHAHLVDTKFGPFYNGLCHPVVTPTDVMAIVALALLAGRAGPRSGRHTLFTLSASWLIGTIVGYGRLNDSIALPAALFAGFNLAIALSVTANWRVPRWALIPLAAIIGLVYGASNGAEFGLLREGAPLSIAGSTTGVFVAATWMTSLAVKCNGNWQQITLRVVGSWIAAANLLLIGWELRTLLGK